MSLEKISSIDRREYWKLFGVFSLGYTSGGGILLEEGDEGFWVWSLFMVWVLKLSL